MAGRVLIVGGGISGLTCAQALVAAGWDVRVLERSAEPPSTGTALGMWPEAMQALDRIGVGDRIRGTAECRSGAALLRPDGRPIAAVETGQITHLVARPRLLEVLAEGLPEGVVHWGVPVVGCPDLDGADVLIGADGINSVVRAEMPGGAGRDARALGTVAFRGTVDGATDRISETWGRGRLFGITPQDASTTNWFACVRTSLLTETVRRTPAETMTGLLHSLYGDWHPEVRRVLEQIGGTDVDRRELAQMPPLRSYGQGRVAVLGDAAHAMAPNLGRGACEALVDAVALADALVNEASVPEAIARYDRLRRRPTRRLVRASAVMNRLSTARRAVRLRDAAVGVAGRFVPRR